MLPFAVLFSESASAGEDGASAGIMPTALIELDGTASETYDGGNLTYEWTQLDGPKVELSDSRAPKPYFRTGKPGLYRFQLIVGSGSLKSEPFVVEIMIERDNQPPVARVAAEIMGEVDKILEVNGRQSSDPEGSALTYRWRFLSGDPGVPPEMLSQPVLAFTPSRDGVYELELVVSDGEAVSRPAVTRLYIKPRPRPPVAKARAVAREIPSAPPAEQAMAPPAAAKPIARIDGPPVVKAGEKVLLDARGSRGFGPGRLSYLWRQKSGPFVSDFETEFDGAAQRFMPPRPGEYEFELVVSDGTMDSDPAVHALKAINDAEPPVAVVVAPERAMPGALVKLDASRSYDLEGSSLTYRWRQTGGPKVTNYLIDDKLGDSAPAFHPPRPGTYSFELVVSNGRLASRPVNIDIEVGDSLAVPVSLAVEGPLVAGVGAPVTLRGKLGGAGGKAMRLSWRQIEGPAVSDGRPRGDALDVTLPMPGRYVFDVTAVEDGKVAATARHVVEAFRQNADAGSIPPSPSRVVPPMPPVPAMPPLPAIPPMTTAAPETNSPAVPPPGSGAGPALAPFPVNQTLEPLRPIPEARPAASAAPAPAAPPPATTHVVDNPVARPVARIHPSTIGGGLYAFPEETSGEQVRQISGPPGIPGF